MSLIATVADPVTDPVPAGWDEFVEAHRLHPVWRSRVLRVVDWCARAPSSLVLVRDAGSSEPVALYHARHLGLKRVGRFAQPGRLPPAGVTECRISPGIGPGVAFSDQLDHADRVEACRVFERAMRRRTGPGYPFLLYRRVPEEHVPVLRPDGRVRMRSLPDMLLRIEWPDLAGYLASLPGKWRSQLRRIRGTVQSSRLRVELAEAVEPEDAGWLVEVVNRRYRSTTVPLPPWPARMFTELGQAPGCQFLTYRDELGRLVGCAIMLDNGRELLDMLWGSRELTDGGYRDLYFDQYLRLVEQALRLGREWLRLGPGMAGIKARYGARPVPRWALVGLR